jgi:hypothetical protein
MNYKSKNMTEEHLSAVMDALPEQLDAAELCALTLTIYNAYEDDPAEVISSLVTNVYTYADTHRIDHNKISQGLRMVADLYETQQNNQTAH